MPSLILTRQQLYDRAWTTPIETLAEELGLSGRGLGKLCARHDIPVPPRGYWAKKAAGKRVSKPALPSPDTHGQKIHFNGPPPDATPDEPQAEVHPLVAFEGLSGNRVSVPENLQLTNPLVLKTQRLLTRAKRDTNGLILVPAGALHIHTSRAMHERALRIMQALLTAFETRGFPVTSTGEGVTILDESLGFGIEEQTKKVEHRTSFTEQKLIDRGLGWQIPKTDLVPSGDLTLVITNVHGVRQRWSEGANSRLEEMVNKFLVGLVRAALGLKRQRAEAERKERERQEEERKREQEKRREAAAAMRWREEQGKVERLERLAAVWRRNQELRRLVASVQTAVGDVDANSELGKWLTWASNHAEKSDPLRRFLERKGGTVTLYYHGYDHDHVSQRGFKEPEPAGYGNEKTKSGVELTERPPPESLFGYDSALKLELPEDLVLPFEWAQESDWYWRVFRVPAAVLNRVLGHGEPEGAEGDVDADDGQ